MLNNTPPALGNKKSLRLNSFHARSTRVAAQHQVIPVQLKLGRGNLTVSLQLNYRLRQA
jgi:hypothetical protein